MPDPTIRISFPRVVSFSTGTAPGGTIDHGSLAGLADDDHTQYHNNTRGDARYSPLGHTHTSLSAVDIGTLRLTMSGGRYLLIQPSEEGGNASVSFTVQ